jgi:heme/copper-type cytochrome/quinol oxidase subunit 2
MSDRADQPRTHSLLLTTTVTTSGKPLPWKPVRKPPVARQSWTPYEVTMLCVTVVGVAMSVLTLVVTTLLPLMLR